MLLGNATIGPRSESRTHVRPMPTFRRLRAATSTVREGSWRSQLTLASTIAALCQNPSTSSTAEHRSLLRTRGASNKTKIHTRRTQTTAWHGTSSKMTKEERWSTPTVPLVTQTTTEEDALLGQPIAHLTIPGIAGDQLREGSRQSTAQNSLPSITRCKRRTGPRTSSPTAFLW